MSNEKNLRSLVASEFALLVEPITDKTPRRVGPSMGKEALALLAFDAEQRHALAEVRAWVKSSAGLAVSEDTPVQKPKTNKRRNRKATKQEQLFEKLEPEQPTAMQKKMEELLARQKAAAKGRKRS